MDGTKVLALAIGLAVILTILWPRTVFLLALGNGEAHLARGKLPPRVVSDVTDMAAGDPAIRGTIRGVRELGRFHVRYSRSLPAGVRQRFRNVWALHIGRIR